MPNSQSRPVNTDDLVAENVHAIILLADLLAAVPEALYRQTFGARQQHVIGKHVRHIIDHYLSFIKAVSTLPTTPLNYENRQRDETFEQDKHAARDRLLAIVDSLEQLTRTPEIPPLQMEHVSDNEQGAVGTTVDRELIFLSSHTIHHMAIIAMLAEQSGLDVPDGFGVHPSTLRHQQRLQKPIARSA